MITILLKGKTFVVKGLKEAQRLLEAGGKIIDKSKKKSKIEESIDQLRKEGGSPILDSTLQVKNNAGKLFKDGGLAKKTKSKKSRGSGAAIKGTKFKGVF